MKSLQWQREQANCGSVLDGGVVAERVVFRMPLEMNPTQKRSIHGTEVDFGITERGTMVSTCRARIEIPPLGQRPKFVEHLSVGT